MVCCYCTFTLLDRAGLSNGTKQRTADKSDLLGGACLGAMLLTPLSISLLDELEKPLTETLVAGDAGTLLFC